MLISVLKEKLEEFGWGEFRDLVRDEFGENKETKALKKLLEVDLIESIDSGRALDDDDSPSTYSWVFQIGDQFYRIDGSYDSWNGTEMDDVESIYEVKKVEVTVERWSKV